MLSSGVCTVMEWLLQDEAAARGAGVDGLAHLAADLVRLGEDEVVVADAAPQADIVPEVALEAGDILDGLDPLVDVDAGLDHVRQDQAEVAAGVADEVQPVVVGDPADVLKRGEEDAAEGVGRHKGAGVEAIVVPDDHGIHAELGEEGNTAGDGLVAFEEVGGEAVGVVGEAVHHVLDPEGGEDGEVSIAHACKDEVRLAQLGHHVLDDLQLRVVWAELALHEAVGSGRLVGCRAQLEEHQVTRQLRVAKDVAVAVSPGFFADLLGMLVVNVLREGEIGADEIALQAAGEFDGVVLDGFDDLIPAAFPHRLNHIGFPAQERRAAEHQGGGLVVDDPLADGEDVGFAVFDGRSDAVFGGHLGTPELSSQDYTSGVRSWETKAAPTRPPGVCASPGLCKRGREVRAARGEF